MRARRSKVYAATYRRRARFVEPTAAIHARRRTRALKAQAAGARSRQGRENRERCPSWRCSRCPSWLREVTLGVEVLGRAGARRGPRRDPGRRRQFRGPCLARYSIAHRGEPLRSGADGWQSSERSEVQRFVKARVLASKSGGASAGHSSAVTPMAASIVTFRSRVREAGARSPGAGARFSGRSEAECELRADFESRRGRASARPSDLRHAVRGLGLREVVV
jgi:hypothetical protein